MSLITTSRLLPSALLLVPIWCGAACNPFERRSGSYGAGAVDPIHFPAPYLGDGGDGKRPGSGRFSYVTASWEWVPLASSMPG